MNKAELLQDIKSKGAQILSTDLVESIGDINSYIVNVFSAGEDVDAGDIAQKRNIYFYVNNEGKEGEAAYYQNNTWFNPEKKNAIGSTLANIAGIYSNSSLRERTKGAMIKASFDIINEDSSTEKHTERLQLAKDIMLDADSYINAFMFFVASNAAVQLVGGAATDNDLSFVVATSWNLLI